ncbi:MAG: aminoacyl-histidine dipeptidase [Acidobacteria bacterium]|nr:aminoacyl-histidine dipeptidase [Acidobacteriota bacterium]
MSSKLIGLKPEKIWKHFFEILKIPHCSGNEKALGDYVLNFAKQCNLESERDSVGNVVVRKPGTKGLENTPGIILQGHMDMVGEKNSDVDFDFSSDGIKAVVDGEWLRAEGTTLGADNGIGLAASLALMEDDTAVHGPLEFLFTVEEETGLTGATQLKPGFLRGKYLLNLDSEDWGEFTIGCAGGADTEIILPLERRSTADGDAYLLKLTGFKGGHSGVDIHLGRANAIKCLARILYQVGRDVPFLLVDAVGGNLRNAIPREAWAHVYITDDHRDDFEKKKKAAFDKIVLEYKAVEPTAAVSFEKADDVKLSPLNMESQRSLINLLYAIPHGVVSMHAEMKELVETSSNLAVVRTEKNRAKIICSTRSSVASAIEATRHTIAVICELADADVTLEDGYPGWTPNLASPLLKTMKGIYRNSYNEEPHISAIHAGLECGIIGEKYEGMDMISFGPTIKFPHSPDEKLHIASVSDFWDFLVLVLNKLAG